MQTIKAGEKGMWVRTHVLVILFQDPPQEFVFGVVDGLDDETVVSREVEEGT